VLLLGSLLFAVRWGQAVMLNYHYKHATDSCFCAVMLRYIVETQTVIMGDSKGKGKQWRYVRTKIRNRLKLGTHPGVAIPMCLTRKAPGEVHALWPPRPV